MWISDPSLTYLCSTKVAMSKFRQTRLEFRNNKRFNKHDFIQNLSRLSWIIVTLCEDPNGSWQIWKSLFLGVLDRHAPILYNSINQNPVSRARQ